MAVKEYERRIAEYNEDLEFNLTLFHEFGAREEDAYLYNSNEEETGRVQDSLLENQERPRDLKTTAVTT
jgi:hypothetical protein